MAEELKSEIGKLENLIGCEKADITSKDSIEELIEALNSKYKSDIHSSIRLHRLEFYQALIEDARLKKKKSVEVEETFLLAKDDTDAKKEAKTVEVGDLERPTEVVSVPPEDIDEWVM
ncbi:hypothetical protein JTE90_011275 [Oedothorax gibbosus]|uniref:Uncharacterized protein n=1 Tax=Oedothorax gibbosus TaxID=931172 RepID=A0AAV6TXU5_9ARAC|nr:hypothetical protein JTE90_011275 [Oedothorax gibbosus]